MQRPGGLLLVFLAGLLAAVVASPGLPPPRESCNSLRLAAHINVLYIRPDPVTAADPSCAVVRSGVDSSLAATRGVTPCLCLLDGHFAFRFTGLIIQDVPDRIYAPCGGRHVKKARRLATRCQGIIHPPSRSPSPAQSPAPSVM